MPSKIALSSLVATMVRRPIRNPISLGGGGTAWGAAGGGSYWYEDGAVWLMSPNSAKAPQIVGFSSVTAMKQFCGANGGVMLPSDYAAYTGAFSAQDFPVLCEPAKCWLFASQFVTPFALSFLTSLSSYFPGHLTNLTSSVGPMVPWTSVPLAVTGRTGPTSVPLAYVAISSTADVAAGITTQWE